MFDLHVKPVDIKYFKEEGDPDFNPERNKWVIDQTIKQTNKRMREQYRKYKEGLDERIHAVSKYLTSKHGAHSNKPIEKYLGRKYLAYLRGEGIKDTIIGKISKQAWQKAKPIPHYLLDED